MSEQEAPFNEYVIDYGCGVASFWTRETEARAVQQEFYTAANNCLGIRKSLAGYRVTETYRGALLPIPFRNANGMHLLTHSGDTILFDAATEFEGDWWKLHTEYGNWCSCTTRGVPELACEAHHFYVKDHDVQCKCMEHGE